jgi:hypothetical protein
MGKENFKGDTGDGIQDTGEPCRFSCIPYPESYSLVLSRSISA